MSVDLHWLESEDGKYRWLRAGCSNADLASLAKRKKYWEAWIHLPGCRASKQYGPLEQQVASVEASVREWFGFAMMVEAPVTHRCNSLLDREDENWNPVKVRCPAIRRADGKVERNCGEPCSWIMGKSGHGDPPWESTPEGFRRDPGQPDEGWERGQ